MVLESGDYLRRSDVIPFAEWVNECSGGELTSVVLGRVRLGWGGFNQAGLDRVRLGLSRPGSVRPL